MSSKLTVFSPELLQDIFRSRVFTDHDFKSPHQYWIPLISLFSGLRLKEICDLRLVDVTLESGVWGFAVNVAPTETKFFRTTRYVPVHSTLLDLGFVGYLNEIKEKDELMLFPDVFDTNNRSSSLARKRLGRWLISAAGAKDSKASFKNFRGTFVDFFCATNWSPSTLSYLLGYKDPFLGHSCRNQSRLREAVDSFHPGIDVYRTIKPWLPGAMQRAEARKKLRLTDKSLLVPEGSLDAIAKAIAKPKQRI